MGEPRGSAKSALVIVPWGMPAQWRTVTYELEGKMIQFCTTLPILLAKFEGADVALLVLDSLVDEYDRERQRKPPVQSVCYDCYDELREPMRKASEAGSYGELRVRVRRFVENYVECLKGRCSRLPENWHLHVAVCPAVGSPGGGWSFEGRASDFEAVALYELGRLCAEHPYRRVVLDLSHGVNFMPALALRLAEELTGMLLAAHSELLDGGVELLVYNSDPAPLSAAPGRPLSVNEIARARVTSVPVPHELPQQLLKRRERLEAGLDKEVERVNRRYQEAARLALSALYHPMPLALCHSHRKARESFSVLDEAFELWLRCASVERNTVRRRLSLNPKGVYALLLAGSAAKRLESASASYPTDLDKLVELAQLYRAVNENYYYLVMNELSRIEGALRRSAAAPTFLFPPTPLYELLGEKPGKPVLNKRVMIAHAGLQKEFVEVHGGWMLKYIDSLEEGFEQQLCKANLLLEMRD